mmetsp:Transcript_169/g.373  ORF Transcript_169/g.373 Transcript_169/m.373 type:complete len:161 (+) Transcript_169:65-547(+)
MAVQVQYRKVASLALLGAVLCLAMPTLFCTGNTRRRVARDPATARNGWRFDMMEIGPKGIGQLVVHEGYYVGEQAFYDIMSKQGRRYRMRPTPEDYREGKNGADLFQLGPFKFKINQIFGGTSCSDEKNLVQPQGYRGCAGCAGWDKDLPNKGGGNALFK